MFYRAAFEAAACRSRDGNQTACARSWTCRYSNATGRCFYSERVDRAMASLLMCKYSTFSRYATACYEVQALKACVAVHQECHYFSRTYLPRGVPDSFHCVLRTASDPREVYAAYSDFDGGNGDLTGDWFGECSTSELVMGYFGHCQWRNGPEACAADPVCLWESTAGCRHSVPGGLRLLLGDMRTAFVHAVLQANAECASVDISHIADEASREEACLDAGAGQRVPVNVSVMQAFQGIVSVSDLGAAAVLRVRWWRPAAALLAAAALALW